MTTQASLAIACLLFSCLGPALLGCGSDPPASTGSGGSGAGGSGGAAAGSSGAGGQGGGAQLDPNTEVLAKEGMNGPQHLALDATHVYYANDIAKNVKRVPRAGGEPELLIKGQAGPIAVQEGVLGVVAPNEKGVTELIRVAPPAAPEVVMDYVGSTIAAHGGFFYFFSANDGLVRIPLMGTEADVEIIKADATAFRVDGDVLSMREGGSLVLLSLPDLVETTPAVTLDEVGANEKVMQHTIDAGIVYWLSSSDATFSVWSEPLMGGSAALLGAADGRIGAPISVDASRVFFLSVEEVKTGLWGRVHSMPKAGGDISSIGALVGLPKDLKLGGDGYVYVAAFGTTGIAGDDDDNLGQIIRIKLPE
jgi:hypothetical protein